MIPLIRLKKDVSFNRELTFVVDILKGIATARYFALSKQLALSDEFTQVCLEFLAPFDLERLDHPFARGGEGPAAVLMVTSDAGFLGGLNHQVISAGIRAGGAGAVYSVVGERGAGILQDAQRHCTVFPGIQDATRMALAATVRDHLVRSILSAGCGKLLMVYPKPVTFSHQQAAVETLLPCSAWREPAARRSVSPQTIWESSPQRVVEYVASQWLAHRLAYLFAQSRLSELSARSVHLEGSYQELIRQGKTLRHQYFRARHEVIDRSMREIFAAQLLYGKG